MDQIQEEYNDFQRRLDAAREEIVSLLDGRIEELMAKAEAIREKRIKSLDEQSKSTLKTSLSINSIAAEIKQFGSIDAIWQRKQTSVPAVDKTFPGFGESAIYSDQGTSYNAILSAIDFGSNQNKFYVIQLIEKSGDFFLFTRWGRIGAQGQQKIVQGSPHDLVERFESTFFNKTGIAWRDRDRKGPVPGKYQYIQVENEDEDGEPPQEISRNIPTQSTDDDHDLVQKMENLGIDSNILPLRSLKASHIDRATETLESMSDEIRSGSPSREKLLDLCSRYYTLLPRNFGRQRPPVISTQDQVDEEIARMKSLYEICNNRTSE